MAALDLAKPTPESDRKTTQGTPMTRAVAIFGDALLPPRW
jgi:hypothetical protein